MVPHMYNMIFSGQLQRSPPHVQIMESALTISMYYHCKKRSSRMSLRSAKNSSKTIKTTVYRAVEVYSWDGDDVTLEDVSSTQQCDENPMIPEG